MSVENRESVKAMACSGQVGRSGTHIISTPTAVRPFDNELS